MGHVGGLRPRTPCTVSSHSLSLRSGNASPLSILSFAASETLRVSSLFVPLTPSGEPYLWYRQTTCACGYGNGKTLVYATKANQKPLLRASSPSGFFLVFSRLPFGNPGRGALRRCVHHRVIHSLAVAIASYPCRNAYVLRTASLHRPSCHPVLTLSCYGNCRSIGNVVHQFVGRGLVSRRMRPYISKTGMAAFSSLPAWLFRVSFVESVSSSHSLPNRFIFRLYRLHQLRHAVLCAGFADGLFKHLPQFLQRGLRVQHPRPADLLQIFGQAAQTVFQ